MTHRSISLYVVLSSFASPCLALAADAASDAAPMTNSPAAAPSDTPAPKPLMAGLDAIGVGEPLNKANINLYGFVQAGYFYDFSAPDSGSGPTYIGYNNIKNRPILDKVDLTLERTVDATEKQFDVGFRVEGIYGYDAGFIHSNGMFDDQTGENQGDLLQAYVDIATPGLPLRWRIGKWIELAGFEQFSANIYGAFGDPARAFYSYSYQFLYAEPGTQTGVLGTYFLNNQWSFDAGITRGWNQSTDDTNDAIDFLGRATYTPTNKTSVIFVMTEGPEYPPGVGDAQPAGDNGDWWTALDLVVTHKLTDALSIGTGIDYVYAPNLPIPGGSGSQWWGGVAGYASYAIDNHFTLNSRIEWYQDSAGGYSLGAPTGGNFYEATLGLAIRPMPGNAVFSNLLFRPEIRYDWSDHPAYDSGEFSELTFAVDVLFTF